MKRRSRVFPDLIGTNTGYWKFIIFINANNGCLGDFGRGRTQTAAILVGEVPSTSDPAVSEWRNPVPIISGLTNRKNSSARNYIAVGWERRELKHLSNARKRHHMRFP